MTGQCFRAAIASIMSAIGTIVLGIVLAWLLGEGAVGLWNMTVALAGGGLAPTTLTDVLTKIFTGLVAVSDVSAGRSLGTPLV